MENLKEEIKRLLRECENRRDYIESLPTFQMTDIEHYTNVGYLNALSEFTNDLKEILGINV